MGGCVKGIKRFFFNPGPVLARSVISVTMGTLDRTSWVMKGTA